MALPSVLVVMLMRYLSKKYTVAVTELMAGDDGGRKRYTTWGKKITDIIYWRPPQANISMFFILLIEVVLIKLFKPQKMYLTFDDSYS